MVTRSCTTKPAIGPNLTAPMATGTNTTRSNATKTVTSTSKYRERDAHEILFRPALTRRKRTRKTKQDRKKPKPWSDKQRAASARAHWILHHSNPFEDRTQTVATQPAQLTWETANGDAIEQPIPEHSTTSLWAAPAPLPDDTSYTEHSPTTPSPTSFSHRHSMSTTSFWSTKSPFPTTISDAFTLPTTLTTPTILGHHNLRRERRSLSFSSPAVIME